MKNHFPIPQFTYALRGWEDGQPFHRSGLKELDRWAVQSADEVTIDFDRQHSSIGAITIQQDPHSSELGGYLWGSSVILACFMESYLRRMDGDEKIGGRSRQRRTHKPAPSIRPRPLTRFLELGSGISGVPAIALGRLGKMSVATDLPCLMDTLRHNVAMNQQEFYRAHAFPLEWSVDTTENNLEFNQQLLDIMNVFRDPVSGVYEGLDAVVMADCIYAEASAPALVETLAAVCRLNAQLYLADCNSEMSSLQIFCMSEVRNRAAQEEFVRYAGRYFDVRLMELSEWHPLVPEKCRLDFINFYQLKFISETVLK